MQIRHFRWAAGVKFYFKIRNFPEHRILVLGTPICKAVINFKNFCQMKHPMLYAEGIRIPQALRFEHVKQFLTYVSTSLPIPGQTYCLLTLASVFAHL